MDDLTPEARHMLDALAGGGWVDWRECVRGAQNASYVLMYANELRAKGGYRIGRRGYREEEAYRLLPPT